MVMGGNSKENPVQLIEVMWSMEEGGRQGERNLALPQTLGERFASYLNIKLN